MSEHQTPSGTAIRSLIDATDDPFLLTLLGELADAEATWPPIHSHHEGYAVLLEEVEEYWEIVRQKEHLRHPQAMYRELVQIATVAWRIVRSLGLMAEDPSHG